MKKAFLFVLMSMSLVAHADQVTISVKSLTPEQKQEIRKSYDEVYEVLLAKWREVGDKITALKGTIGKVKGQKIHPEDKKMILREIKALEYQYLLRTLLIDDARRSVILITTGADIGDNVTRVAGNKPEMLAALNDLRDSVLGAFSGNQIKVVE